MNGIILINKTQNLTSHDIVYKVKKIVKEKVGHAGTLDPMATGVLPILIGKGTLCSKYLINHDKIYETTIQLGKKTDTADSEGMVIEEKEVKKDNLQEGNIQKILNTFIGKQEQIPPMYSAIKVNGKKLYEYARKGEKIEIKPRNIEIYALDLLNIDKDKKQITLKISCSKGTYIRSLCEDIAKSLDTVGYMIKLNRIKVDKFDIEKSITLKEIENSNNSYESINKHLITIEELFNKNEELILDNKRLLMFLNGVKLKINKKDGVYRIYVNNLNKELRDIEFIGIGVVSDGFLKRDIIIKELSK